MSIFMAVATAGYAHSLASVHRWLRRTLVRRAGGDAEAGTPPAQPIRWQRIAVAAAVVFATAMGAVTTVEAAGRAAACEPAWKPAAARGEHVGGCDRGTVGCTGAPGSGHLRYVAAGVGAHHHGAGCCCTNDRAGGDRPQHHGSQRHRLDHDHP